jgi:hypothetical protein
LLISGKKFLKLAPLRSLYQEFKNLTNEIILDRPAGGSVL